MSLLIFLLLQYIATHLWDHTFQWDCLLNNTRSSARTINLDNDIVNREIGLVKCEPDLVKRETDLDRFSISRDEIGTQIQWNGFSCTLNMQFLHMVFWHKRHPILTGSMGSHVNDHTKKCTFWRKKLIKTRKNAFSPPFLAITHFVNMLLTHDLTSKFI